MFTSCMTFLASFAAPYEIGNNAASLLWIAPLVAAVAIVWKVLKLPVVTMGKFVREVIILFGTILLFIAIIAVSLYIISRLIIG